MTDSRFGLPVWVFGMLVAAFGLLVYNAWYSMHAFDHLSNVHSRQLDNINAFNQDVLTSHLYLAKHLIPPYEAAYLNRYRESAKAARDRLERLMALLSDDRYSAEISRGVVADIRALDAHWSEVEKFAERRIADPMHGGTNSPLDIEYDKALDLSLEFAGDIGASLRNMSRMEQADYRRNRGWLMVSVVVFMLLVLYLLRRADADRRLHAEIAEQAAGANRRFRDMVHQSPFSTQLFSIDGMALQVNPAWEQLWGITLDDIRGYNILEDEQLEALGVMDEIRRGFAGEAVGIPPINYNPAENKEYSGPEREHWVRAFIYPLRDAHGQISHIVLMHEDVTEQVTSSEALRRSEHHLREAQRVAHAGSWELNLISNDLWWSDEVYRIFEIDQQRFGASYEAFLETVHPEDREALDAAYFRHLEEDTPYDLVHRLRFVDEHGNERIKYVHERCVTERDASGRALRSIGTVQDITEMHAKDERMRVLASALEHSPVSVLVMDADAGVVFANKAAERVFGQSWQQMLGAHPAMLRGGSVGDEVDQRIMKAIGNGQVWQGEVSICVSSADCKGQARVLQRVVAPVKDDADRITNYVCVDMDITADKEQQEKMEHTQRLESLGVLAGGIAHDFNNLLTVIMGHAALARSKDGIVGRARESFDAIEEASRRAADLCKQMLAYSGKGKFVVEPLDLSALVRDMTQLLHVSIHKSVQMRDELADHLPAIEADVAQMQQVVMNLVINANEAIGDKGGMIVLATGVMDADADYLQSVDVDNGEPEAGTYIFLEVTDNGCGMSDAVKKRLFEPFFTTKFTGRGLGMSAILGIVRGHHGAIKVYSEEGKGTTFKVLFPALDARVEVAGESNQPAQVMQGGGTVLVVDDEDMIRNATAQMLEMVGYRTLTAGDGVEAVELFKAHHDQIDCVLLDMTMPRMGGEQTFTELRKIRPDVCVVLSSGYNHQAATQRFTGKGLAGFVQKPYTKEALYAKLAEAMEKRGS